MRKLHMIESNHSNRISNLDYLRELCEGDIDFVNEMIDIFVKDCPVDIAKFQQNIDEKYFEGIRQSAHKLRSTIPYLGLHVIENDISEIEQLAGERIGLSRISVLFERIKSVCLQTVKELRP